MNRRRHLQIALVLLCFTTLGIARHLHNFGEDLSASYIGCRLLAAGEGDHLYSHSPTDFSKVGDPAWEAMARLTEYHPVALLHPYVQTPLWAFSLEPLCTRMNFRAFCDGFIVVFMLCSSLILWLVARYWTPALLHPGWMALVYFGLYRSEPFKYAIYLAQTHVLYLFMTVLALILAERRRPVWAGVLLALAAAVKITPGFLLVYWLFTRRYKAALSFTGTFALLTALTPVLLGTGLMHAYGQSLAQNANVLLLAFNNQSLAAWWMGLHQPKKELMRWNMYHLPAGMRVLSGLLSLASAGVGGWIDRRAARDSEPVDSPFGAIFAMIGATLFAPIAWTHYFILLVIPVMFFLQAARQTKAKGWIACILLILVLNLYPVSFGSVHLISKRITIVRSQFYSGLFSMGALAVLAYRRKSSGILSPA